MECITLTVASVCGFASAEASLARRNAQKIVEMRRWRQRSGEGLHLEVYRRGVHGRGVQDGAYLLSSGVGSASGASTAASGRSGCGGAASRVWEDEDETSAVGGRRGVSADEPRYTTDY